MNKKFGIDISKWQGDFDLAKAVNNHKIEFVIIKAGGSDNGVYTDRMFEDNYYKAKIAKLPVGCYWFSKAMNTEAAKTDAEYFLELMKGKQFELPVYIDVENKQQLALPKTKLTEIVDTFCSIVEQAGYYVGIYSSLSYFHTYLNDTRLNKYTRWVASWGCNKPGACGIWQFGGETNLIQSNKINGITVDQNFMYIDFETTIRKNGLNGFRKDDYHEPEPDTLGDLIRDIIKKGYSCDEIIERTRKLREE